MSHTVAADHPIQEFWFYVDEDFDREISGFLKDHLKQLATSRSWTIGPPEWFHESVDGESRETIGGSLEMYSAWPPHKLPREVDVAHFEEAFDVVEAIKAFSARHSLPFELRLDRVLIGHIENGEADCGVTDTFLGEWMRALEASRPGA
jgi:hypothetical protein